MRLPITTLLALGLLVAAPLDDGAPVPPYPDAIERIVRAEREGEWEEALAAAEELLAQSAERRLTEYQRAEVHFAAGVVLAGRRDVEDPEDLRRAVPPFESARALAGPGELRLDAGYDLGVTELARGERWRERIPELSDDPMAAMAAPATSPGDEEPPDPLAEARAAYLAAKERLLVRLRADWGDEDTRANLELIQRRLRELDEIEKRREEQEQQETEDQEGDESEDSQDPGEEGEQRQTEENPEENEGGEESEGEQEGKVEAPQEQETDPLETDAAEDEPPPSEGETRPAPAERRLTREEVMRLLQSLGDIEARGEALQERLNAVRREAVKRDW